MRRSGRVRGDCLRSGGRGCYLRLSLPVASFRARIFANVRVFTHEIRSKLSWAAGARPENSFYGSPATHQIWKAPLAFVLLFWLPPRQ